MVRCSDCGRIFEESELKAVQESRGEFWGSHCYETIYICPYCDFDSIEDYKEDEEDASE